MRARLLTAAGLLLAAAAQAAVPQRLNYQGKLADASGNPLSGTYSFRFKLFAAEAGGAALFTEDVDVGDAVSVVNGLYSVQIGSYTPGGIPYGVFENEHLYLEIDVAQGISLATAETLTPRERLSAAAWAVHALGAERLGAGAVVATFTATGKGSLQLPSGSTITAAGTLSLSTAASAALTGDPAIFIAGNGEVRVGTVTAPLGAGAVKLRVNGNLWVDNEVIVTAPTTASDPAYTFQNDNNSGMYQPLLDEVAFAAGGVEALRLRGLGGTFYALETSSGVDVGAGPLNLNSGGFIRFPDGSSMATAGAGGNFVSRSGDGMTGALTVNAASVTVLNSGNAQAFVLAATSATNRSSYHLYVATTGEVSMGRAGLATAGSRLDVAGPVFVGGTPGSLFLGGGGWPYSIGVGWNGQDSKLRMNAVGTGGGTADYRDLWVYDGKTNPIAAFEGSTARFGVNTTGPDSDVDVFRPAGSYPTFRLSDGNVTLPDYSGSSSVGEVSQSNAVLHIKSNRGGSGTTATGGALIQGFTEAGTNDWNPLHLVGTHGGTAPTAAAVTISGQKHSGSNNRSQLAGAEPVLDVETNYGGTLLMRVEGGGRVGVGVSAPSARLHVSSAAAATADTVLLVSSGVAAGQELLVVKGDGKVGIGTASSLTRRLQVRSTNGQGMLLLNDGTGNSVLEIQSLQNAQRAINFLDAAGTAATQIASYGTTAASSMTFRTSGVERMAIDENGNVGIGTSTPVSRLDVGKDDAVNNSTVTVLSIAHTTSGTPAPGIGARLDFRVERSDGSLSVPGFIAGLYTDVTAGSEDGDLVFGTIANSAGQGSEKMRVTSGGGVGINQTAPSGKLDVRSETTTEGTLIARFTDSTPTPMVEIFDSNDGTASNTANAVIKVKRALSTGRSINAAGTINASGADYAEWIPWPGEKPEPGTIVRYKNTWLVVSSTRTAAFTGNDVFGQGAAILVAFSGQVPVKVRGKVAEGDYILPAPDGTGFAVGRESISFEQYREAVGIAWEASAAEGSRRINVAVGLK